jgi:hypothetical protein
MMISIGVNDCGLILVRIVNLQYHHVIQKLLFTLLLHVTNQVTLDHNK